MSRIWSLNRLITRNEKGKWDETTIFDPESANNESLNLLADELGKLNIVDVRKKPTALAALFRANNIGTQLAPLAAPLSEFGFALDDHDPLAPERIEPFLIGEGGSIELTMKTGVKLSLVFGKKFENKRAVLVYASYSRDALAATSGDESEVDFLEPEAKQKATIKNNRFADWFYLIDESDYEKLSFKTANTLK
jgi:hypothetical protein